MFPLIQPFLERYQNNMITFKQYLKENYLLLEALSKSTTNQVNKIQDSLRARLDSEQLAPHPSGDSLGHLRDMLDNRPDHHATWALSRYNRGHIGRLEDMPEVLHHLTIFDQMVERGITNKKALSKLGTPTDLRGHISSKDPNILTTSNYSAKDLDHSEYTVTHENDDFRVIVPHTQKASICFGSPKLCTAKRDLNHNQFDYYTKTSKNPGPLYMLIPKRPIYPQEMYQIHLPSGQFMDENDQPVRRIGMEYVFKDRSAPTGSVFEKLYHMSKGIGNIEEQEKIFRGTKDESLKDYFVRLHPHLKLIDLDINHPRNHEKFAVHGTPEQKLYLAAAPYLSRETQIILSKQQELIGKIGKLLFNRQDLHPDVHSYLVKHGNHDIHTALVNRQDLHPDAHYSLAAQGDHDIHTALMGRQDLHPDAQYSLAIHGNHDILTALVNRPDLHPSAQRQSAQSGNHDIHIALVNRPDLSDQARIFLDERGKFKQ